MARSQIQYQPITGPVWREPVAENMQWLPKDQARTREISLNRITGYVIPFVAAIAAATGMSWLPQGSAQAQRVPRRVDAINVIAPFQQPAAFDASQFPFTTTAGVLRVERRTPSAFVEPFIAALYKHEELQWLPAGAAYQLRWAIRPVQVWSLLSPVPITAAFDPAQFPWAPVTLYRPLERRPIGDVVEPFVAALYRPDGLQWIPTGREQPRSMPRSVQTWSLLSPFQIAAPFDPATFPWMPTTLFRFLERRTPSVYVEPFTAALYKPEGLQWLLAGSSAIRKAPRPVQTWSLLSPFPIPAVVYDPRGLQWIPRGQPLPRAQLRALQTWSLLSPFPIHAAGPCVTPIFSFETAQAISAMSEAAQATSFLGEDAVHVLIADTCGNVLVTAAFYDGTYIHDGTIFYGMTGIAGVCVTPGFTGEIPVIVAFTDACDDPLP